VENNRLAICLPGGFLKDQYNFFYNRITTFVVREGKIKEPIGTGDL